MIDYSPLPTATVGTDGSVSARTPDGPPIVAAATAEPGSPRDGLATLADHGGFVGRIWRVVEAVRRGETADSVVAASQPTTHPPGADYDCGCQAFLLDSPDRGSVPDSGRTDGGVDNPEPNGPRVAGPGGTDTESVSADAWLATLPGLATDGRVTVFVRDVESCEHADAPEPAQNQSVALSVAVVPGDATSTDGGGAETESGTATGPEPTGVDTESVTESVARLATHADTVGAEAATLANDVDDQTDLLGETVQDIQVLTGEIEQMASAVTEVDTEMEQVAVTAGEGADRGATVREDIEQVAATIDSLTERAATVGDQMGSIEDVVDDIGDIADQTNLLALNANIEAARADNEADTGGFEVVASEIKQLADDTGEYTEQIETDIGTLRDDVNTLVEATETANEQLASVLSEVLELIGQFEQIARGVDDSAETLGHLSTAADDQAAQIDTVTAQIEEVQALCETARMTADTLNDEATAQRETLSELQAALPSADGGD
ncbi:MAG: methyl-accepting chemotaxis protein [halophilic archaeon J07HB67]|jgi:Methyl-accepting chemotaxis protein|nr:MAG: methyl-accepting chemotaxis protein [halophilic archaeon J07HB67]